MECTMPYCFKPLFEYFSVFLNIKYLNKNCARGNEILLLKTTSHIKLKSVIPILIFNLLVVIITFQI